MAQSPFPGMDPYLESPSLWPDVHNSLINIFREQISPLLPPRYVAELETQLIIDDRKNDPISAVPDVTIPKPAPTRITSIYLKRIGNNHRIAIA